MNRVYHTLEPVFNKNSKTLILGTMPSVKSRKMLKYYAHKSNRFWKIMEKVYDTKIDDWKKFILDNNLALWDVIESCEIISSSDSSIKKVVPNDISYLISNSKVSTIFLLGKTAYNLYYKYIYNEVGIEGIYLPSPSSANASYSLNDLVAEYKTIKNLTEK